MIRHRRGSLVLIPEKLRTRVRSATCSSLSYSHHDIFTSATANAKLVFAEPNNHWRSEHSGCGNVFFVLS